MRRFVLVLLAAICAVEGTGCCGCGPKVGWSFQVGRPATVAGEVLVSPEVTAYRAAGIATLPALGAAVGTPLAATVPACASAGPSLSLPTTPRPVDPCVGITLQELCQRLIALEASVRAIRPPAAGGPPAKPMPKGSED